MSNNAAHEMGPPALVLEGVRRVYKQGGQTLTVLDDADITIRSGEIVALVGHSGSGKSSLLHIAGLLEAPNAGRVMIDGVDCSRLGDADRTALRRTKLGFVYQFHHLLPEFTALENVMMPQLVAGCPQIAAETTAMDLLETVGLSERATHRPAELSGGEQQRVAIVRALANKPRLLLADEPTGNLDPKTSRMVFERLVEVVRHQGSAALIATHNFDLAAKMDRAVVVHEGKLIDGRQLAD